MKIQFPQTNSRKRKVPTPTSRDNSPGTAIDDAHTLFSQLQGKTMVELFFIPEDAVAALPDAVPAVKGIIKVHQVHNMETGKISVRAVSLAFCACYSPVQHNVK